MNSINELLKDYKAKHRTTRRIVQIYYDKLLKASLLLSIVPIIVVGILGIYDRLSFIESIAFGIAVFFGSMFFAKPYLKDVSSLTYYANSLALGDTAEPPNLSLLGSIDELSQAVKNLHQSWGERTVELEVALAESSILFDTIPDILIMLDEDMNILRANNSAINAFRRGIIVKNLQDLKPEKLLLDLIKQVVKTGHGESIETSFKTNGIKQNYLVMVEKFPIQSVAGISTILIMHNVTEETQRKQLLKEFVANASHEIRTPLTSVVGFIENMQTMEDDKGNEELNNKTRKKFLNIMAQQTDRMTKLVNDLLSLSKAEMNSAEMKTGPVNMSKLLNEIRKSLKDMADEKQMKIALKGFRDLPEITGNYDELMQAFTNIVNNAIKYGNPKTNVEINASVTNDFIKSKYFPRKCKELVLIAVKDQGEGIPEEHLPRITERFYRVDKMRSNKIGGTGLGLAITKHIISRHRGDIVVDSKINKGSTFTVRLPMS